MRWKHESRNRQNGTPLNHQSKKINVATVELDKLDNINEPERYEAKQEVYDFISLLSLEETINFLKEVGCTSTLELVEKVIENPTLIEEAVL